jgi:hypothetical protein
MPPKLTASSGAPAPATPPSAPPGPLLMSASAPGCDARSALVDKSAVRSDPCRVVWINLAFFG